MGERRIDSYRWIRHDNEPLTKRIYQSIIALPDRIIDTVYDFFDARGKPKQNSGKDVSSHL